MEYYYTPPSIMGEEGGGKRNPNFILIAMLGNGFEKKHP